MSKLTDYKNSYIAANYDRINLTVPKGMKAEIEKRARKEGQSTNGFINHLIRQALGESAEAIASAPKQKPQKKAAEPSKKDMDIFLF